MEKFQDREFVTWIVSNSGIESFNISSRQRIPNITVKFSRTRNCPILHVKVLHLQSNLCRPQWRNCIETITRVSLLRGPSNWKILQGTTSWFLIWKNIFSTSVAFYSITEKNRYWFRFYRILDVAEDCKELIRRTTWFYVALYVGREIPDCDL